MATATTERPAIFTRVDPETREALETRAREAERSVAAEVRVAIRKHLASPPERSPR